MLHAPFTNIVKLTFLTVDNPLKNCVFNFCYCSIYATVANMLLFDFLQKEEKVLTVSFRIR